MDKILHNLEEQRRVYFTGLNSMFGLLIDTVVTWCHMGVHVMFEGAFQDLKVPGVFPELLMLGMMPQGVQKRHHRTPRKHR